MCYTQSSDSDQLRILLRKPRIQAFSIIQGSRMQTSDACEIFWNCAAKPRPSADSRAALFVRSFVIRGFFAADGQAAFLARSIVALLPRMAEVLLCYIHNRCGIGRRRAMPGHIVRMTLPLTGLRSCLYGN